MGQSGNDLCQIQQSLKLTDINAVFAATGKSASQRSLQSAWMA
jgi:hypothetical protein